MVFKRRERRSWGRATWELLWPRGGWGRAIVYIRHRLSRLPDAPDRIARGVFAGVFVTFSPLYGFHFIAAFILAKLMRGNVIAALLTTFFGNPVTFPLIAALSLRLGYWMLGMELPEKGAQWVFKSFGRASADLWWNIKAMFTPQTARWDQLIEFNQEVFFPYLIGGLIPGIISGLIAYYVSLPLITAYQNARRGRLQAKLRELAAAAQVPGKDGSHGPAE